MRIAKGVHHMYFDIEKTENDYKIHIIDNKNSITLSAADFQRLKSLYEKEQHIQIMIQMCEQSGKYHNELFIDMPLWDEISSALDTALRKKESSIVHGDDILIHNTIQEMFEKFKTELDVYKLKPKKKGNVS